MRYQNPILRGFDPDPSILCADGAFYLVNSTFQYFPAVRISKSTDLVNFYTVGHAVTNSDWIDLDVPDSHGIWAPDISYADGKYWIFAPLRLRGEGNCEHVVLRRQLVMWSHRPEGPYSKPAVLEVDSIDPSHFVDDDGRHYLVTAPGITVTPLAPDCASLAGETVQVWAGTGLRAPEGPHLFKKDGWYYAVLAEGGTGYGHQVSVARSRALYGPYEPCPHNPILKQRDPSARMQRCGHAKLFQLPDGRWYAVYLCARPLDGQYTVMGRETALQPVTWDADGWPRMGDGTPLDADDMPYPNTMQHLERAFHDGFDAPQLDLDWQFLRTPSAEWSLSERPGYYRIWTQDYGLNDRRGKNTLLHRETEASYTADTSVCFSPRWDGEQAGLCCLYGTSSYIACAVTVRGVEVTSRVAETETQLALLPYEPDGQPVRLRVRVCGRKRSFDCALPHQDWRELCAIPDCTFLSDEGVKDGGKRHTGAMVGLYAHNGGSGVRRSADFAHFHYEAVAEE